MDQHCLQGFMLTKPVDQYLEQPCCSKYITQVRGNLENILKETVTIPALEWRRLWIHGEHTENPDLDLAKKYICTAQGRPDPSEIFLHAGVTR